MSNPNDPFGSSLEDPFGDSGKEESFGDAPETPTPDPFADQIPQNQFKDPFTDSNPYNIPPQAGMYSEQLPDSTAILVLGILSIIGSLCYGVVGLILGIIGATMASKSQRLFEANPTRYTPQSFNNMNAGKICSIIGIVLGSIVILIAIAMVAVVGLERF